MSDFISLANLITTVVLAAITFWYALTTKRTLKVMTDSSLEQARPYVVAQIFAEDLFLHFSVKNFGLRPAKDVLITILPDIDIITQKNEKGEHMFEIKPLLKQAYMPPSYEVKNVMYFGQDFFKRDDITEFVFDVDIQYSDMQNNRFKEKYSINTKNFYIQKRAVYFTDNRHFQSIAKSLDKLKESVESIKNKL